MSMISPYNPEYNAKHWLAKPTGQFLPTAGGQDASIQTSSLQSPAFSTQGGNENWLPMPTGFVQSRRSLAGNDYGNYRNNNSTPLWGDFISTWAKMASSFVNVPFNTTSTTQEGDPYGMVQSPWMRSPSQSSSMPNFFWQV